MKLIIFRHGHSVKREDWNDLDKPDALRPLTEKGTQTFAISLRGLKKMVRNIDAVYSSQFTRAVQSATILNKVYRPNNFQILQCLNPNEPLEEVYRFIDDLSGESTIGIVTHSPKASRIVQNYLGIDYQNQIKLRKASAVCLDISESSASLLWMLDYEQLGEMAMSISPEEDH